MTRLLASVSLALLAMSCGGEEGKPVEDLPDAVAPDGEAPDVQTGPQEVVPLGEDKASAGMAFHEHTLGEELDGDPLNSDDTLVAFLEHPTNLLSSAHDSGESSGVDSFRYEYLEEHEHTFCWDEEPSGDAPHFLVLLDADGQELLRLNQGEGCKTLTLTPGIYTKRLHHGGGQGDGDLIFMTPANSSTLRVLKSPKSLESAQLAATTTAKPCDKLKTIPYSKAGELLPGQVGFANSCTESDNLQLTVFDQNCPDVYTPLGAQFAVGGSGGSGQSSGSGDDCCWINWYSVTTASNLEAVVPGPGTVVTLFQGANYSGRSVTSAVPGKLNCVKPAQTLGDADANHDAKRSFRVFTDFSDPSGNGCGLVWSGLASSLFTDANKWAGPAEGEVVLFTGTGLTGEAFKFTGPCYDLGSICALDSFQSVYVGPKTIAYLYKGVGFLGENYPYKAKTGDLDDYKKMVKSIYVESLTVYNNNTTLIQSRNCDFCSLAGLKVTADENLKGVSLKKANLRGAQLNGVDLSGSLLDGADFTQALLIGANLEGVSAPDTVFKGAQMGYVNLKGATLSRAVFEGDGAIRAANLAYAYMPNAKLDGAHLTGVTMAYAQLYGPQATVTKAYMDGINLANANLSGMNFKQASMKNAEFTGASLINADMSGADLTGSKLINASLQGAIFSNALLYNTQLQNAAISFQAGTLTVTRLGDNDTRVTTTASFGITVLPKETTDADTVCPNGMTSMDGNVYCDSNDELTAPSTPKPPERIPSATKYCPKKPKS